MTFSTSIFLVAQSSRSPSLAQEITAGKIVTGLLALLGALLLIRISSRLFEYLGNRVARTRFFFNRLEPVIRITIWFFAIFLIIDVVSPSRETFWAGIASIGLALGLGAQDLIKNILGGLVAVTDRPYQIGDRVRIGGSYGEIEQIGLRSTKLITPEDTRVSIPNADLLTHHVYNANSGVPHCQVVTDVYVPPDANPDQLLRVGREVAYSSPYLMASRPVVVLVSDHFDRRPYMRVRIKAYVHDHRFENAMMSDITCRAKREFQARGLLTGWAGEFSQTASAAL